MRTETIVIPKVRGRCRWCQCTTRHGCPCGCSWVDADRTLCSACVEIDSMARTPTGRKFLARLVHPLFAARERELEREAKKRKRFARTARGRRMLADLYPSERSR